MDYLAALWISLIAFCILMYVLLDGFTLGMGIILPFIKDRKERDLLFSAVLPTWDGNQTWLVLSGASLYGAFPLAFSMVIPTLYFPLFIMIIALLFRGVVFEFRLKSKDKETDRWDRLALLGATRMIIKMVHDLQKRLYAIAKVALFCVWVSLLIISLWTPFVDEFTKQKWFHSGHTLLLAILPFITTLSFGVCAFGLFFKKEHLPYWASVVIFLCTSFGFGYSMWPYVVPLSTLKDNSSTRNIFITLLRISFNRCNGINNSHTINHFTKTTVPPSLQSF